jgi:hypothetical protein
MPFLVNAQMMNSFERQFSSESGRLVYRRFGKGPAFAVTGEQQEQFRREYVRGCRIMLLVGIILMGGPMVGAAYYLVDRGVPDNAPSGALVMIGATIPSIVAIFWMSFLLVAAPARQLQDAQPVSPALSRNQYRNRVLSRLDYHHLAALPLLGLGMVWRISRDLDPLHGWGRLSWLIPGSLAVLASVQAYRKYRFEQRGRAQ